MSKYKIIEKRRATYYEDPIFLDNLMEAIDSGNELSIIKEYHSLGKREFIDPVLYAFHNKIAKNPPFNFDNAFETAIKSNLSVHPNAGSNGVFENETAERIVSLASNEEDFFSDERLEDILDYSESLTYSIETFEPGRKIPTLSYIYDHFRLKKDGSNKIDLLNELNRDLPEDEKEYVDRASEDEKEVYILRKSEQFRRKYFDLALKNNVLIGEQTIGEWATLKGYDEEAKLVAEKRLKEIEKLSADDLAYIIKLESRRELKDRSYTDIIHTEIFKTLDKISKNPNTDPKLKDKLVDVLVIAQFHHEDIAEPSIKKKNHQPLFAEKFSRDLNIINDVKPEIMNQLLLEDKNTKSQKFSRKLAKGLKKVKALTSFSARSKKSITTPSKPEEKAR